MVGDQASQAGVGGFDQSQLADIVNRKKMGTQRQRNEMMRMGTTDPNSFAMQNQPQLQQAAQPSEFWGAGRKEAENQSPDFSAANLINPLATLGGQQYYYGDVDSSKAQWGTKGYGQQDLGSGKYNILGSDNSVLGTGYKSLADTIKDYRKPSLSVSPTTVYSDASLPTSAFTEGLGSMFGAKPSDDWLSKNNYRLNPNYNPEIGNSQYQLGTTKYQLNDPKWADTELVSSKGLLNTLPMGEINQQKLYDTQAAANQALQQHLGMGITGNSTRDWETLGQLLNYGNITGDSTSPHSLGGNQVADPITGLNTLYGSQALMLGDKLYGYKNALNVDPIKDTWNQQWTEDKSKWYNSVKDHNWDVGASGVGRNFTNTDWWKKNAQFLNGGKDFFLTPDKAAATPGWQNADYYSRNTGKTTEAKGILQKVWEATSPTSLVFNQKFADMQPVGAAVGNYFIPGLGSGLNALDSYSKGDSKGGNSWLTSAVLSYFGGQMAEGGVGGAPVETAVSTGGQAANTMGSSAGGIFGSGIGLGSTAINQAVQSAALGGIGSGLTAANSGKDFQDSALAALMGGASGLAGGGVTNATQGLGQGLSNFLGGASQGALNAAMSNQPILSSALQSGVARGIGGLFNQVSGTTDKQQQSKNIAAGQTLTNLAKLFAKRNK